MADYVENNLAEGVAFLDPLLIPERAVQRAVNCTFRGLSPRTRPGFRARPTVSDNASVVQDFARGYLQGAFELIPDGGSPVMVLVVDGRIYLWEPETGALRRQDASNGPMSPVAERVWARQRAGHLVIQDAVNRPRLVVPGSTRVSRRSALEVPVGTSMANGHGRLSVASVHRQSFLSGDHELAVGVVPDVGLFTFTDTQYFLGGGAHRPPGDFGPIVAQEYISQYDTSTGVGALVVFSERGVCAFATNLPRTDWAANDISLAILPGANNGAVSPDAVVAYGEDLFYLSPEGLKSVRTARATNLPHQVVNLSADVYPIWSGANARLNRFASMVASDSRILYTVSGRQIRVSDGRPARKTFSGILAYNLDRLNGRVDRPIQDGLWTGLDVQRLVTVGERCFAVAWYKNRNVIFEISSEFLHDRSPDGIDRAIGCEIWLRSSVMGAPDQWKAAKRATITLQKLVGRVDVELLAVVDRYPRPLSWGAFTHKAGYEVYVPTAGTRASIPTFTPHPSIRRRIGEMAEGELYCEPVSGLRLGQFREIQPIVRWAGQAVFGQLEIDAPVQNREDDTFCPDVERDTIGLDEPEPSLYNYAMGSAGSAEVPNYVESRIAVQG